MPVPGEIQLRLPDEHPQELELAWRRQVEPSGLARLAIPRNLRSANRFRYSTGIRSFYLGFRVARTLTP